jgi:hypothetical protein
VLTPRLGSITGRGRSWVDGEDGCVDVDDVSALGDVLSIEGRSVAVHEQFQAWLAQAEEGDVQAALAITREALIAHPRRPRNLSAARAWADYAIDLGGPDIRWAVMPSLVFSAFPEADIEHARWVKTVWARAIRRDCKGSGVSLQVDPSLLGPIFSSSCRMMAQSWSVAVASPDVAAAVAAMTAAANRFYAVDETGRELTEQEFEANEASDNPAYTPNYVFEPTADNGVVEVVLDCQDLTSSRMARTILRIAAQECQAAGLQDSAFVRTPYHYCPELDLEWDDATESFLALRE